MNINKFKNVILEDNLIIIGPNYLKKEVLKSNTERYTIKYFDIEEVIQKYIFTYKESTLVYIDKKYNLIPKIGKIILDNLFKVDNKIYTTDKLNKLVEIKEDLISNGYIIFNNNFRKYLTNKKILVLNDNFSDLEHKVINLIKENNDVLVISPSMNLKEELNIYEFNTIDEEVINLANNIYTLVESNVPLNNIKINILSSEYKEVVNRVFNFYNIIKKGNKIKLFSIESIKNLVESISKNIKILDINDVLENSKIDDLIKNKVVNILNKYTNYTYLEEVYDEFIYDLKNTYYKVDDYDIAIEEVDYYSYDFKDDQYLFILGFNQDIIPVIHKDNLYLNDNELLEISYFTSEERNLIEKIKLENVIMNTKNLTISYKLSSNFNDYSKSNYISYLEEKLKINIIKSEYNYQNDKVNKIMLASQIDEYIKYGTINTTTPNLLSSYKDIDYMTYTNKYNKISYDIIKKRLNNKINLSFSNTNTFFRCKFRFLLESIFKLSSYEETISQKIGTLFHDVLFVIYKDNRKDYDNVINEVVNIMYPNPSKKELFYIEKYRKAIINLVNILNDELSKTKYENSYFEKWFSIETNNDLEVNIVGKIDKIMTLKSGNSTYVIVIDYKTGSLHNDFNKVIHGLDMQLLYYLYLIKNTDTIENPVFTGMYLQSVMTEVLPSVNNKTYDQLIIDNMKLSGYTIEDVNRLYEIDTNYSEDSFIKSVKVKADGEFYAYSKVLKEETIDKLIEITGNNINEVINSIKTCDFSINPKKLGSELVGCEYCEFNDICYKSVNDIVELEEYKNLEFLGGEIDDTN